MKTEAETNGFHPTVRRLSGKVCVQWSVMSPSSYDKDDECSLKKQYRTSLSLPSANISEFLPPTKTNKCTWQYSTDALIEGNTTLMGSIQKTAEVTFVKGCDADNILLLFVKWIIGSSTYTQHVFYSESGIMRYRMPQATLSPRNDIYMQLIYNRNYV